MNLSMTSGTYGGGQAQRLLASLLQQPRGAGQNKPTGQTGAASDSPATSAPPPAPAPGSASKTFAARTLASLLSVQEQPGSTDLASKLIGAADSDKDGALSIEEIKAAMRGPDPDSDALTAAVSKLDTDGDGKLSNAELTAAIETRQAQHAGRHGHANRPSSDDLAAKLIGEVDGDKDGALSLDEVNAALSGSKSGATATGDAFGALDSDRDGKLSAAELSAALAAFKPGHGRQAPPQASVSA